MKGFERDGFSSDIRAECSERPCSPDLRNGLRPAFSPGTEPSRGHSRSSTVARRAVVRRPAPVAGSVAWNLTRVRSQRSGRRRGIAGVTHPRRVPDRRTKPIGRNSTRNILLRARPGRTLRLCRGASRAACTRGGGHGRHPACSRYLDDGATAVRGASLVFTIHIQEISL